jgi:hypothetical protein
MYGYKDSNYYRKAAEVVKAAEIRTARLHDRRTARPFS